MKTCLRNTFKVPHWTVNSLTSFPSEVSTTTKYPISYQLKNVTPLRQNKPYHWRKAQWGEISILEEFVENKNKLNTKDTC